MTTYRSAEIDKPQNIILTDIEKRKPAGSEVLIQVKASAICGSDMHLYAGKHPYAKLPSAVGHELSGVIEEIGSSVTMAKVGDRVCVEPLLTCGTCYYCQRGQYDYCENLRLRYRSGSSGFADYYYADERWIHHLPEAISFDEGALLEPLACAIHAVMKAGIKLCDSVCIMGDGPVALMQAQLAIASGATHVYVLGLLEKNLKIAEQFGAIPMKSGSEAVQEILRRTGGRGVDVAIEAVGLPVTFNQALSVVRKGGKAVIFGIFEDEFSAKMLIDAIVREVEIIGTSSYCWDFQRGLDLISTGRVDLKPLITHHFKLCDIKKAMDIKQDHTQQPLKIILEP